MQRLQPGGFAFCSTGRHSDARFVALGLAAVGLASLAFPAKVAMGQQCEARDARTTSREVICGGTALPLPIVADDPNFPALVVNADGSVTGMSPNQHRIKIAGIPSGGIVAISDATGARRYGCGVVANGAVIDVLRLPDVVPSDELAVIVFAPIVGEQTYQVGDDDCSDPSTGAPAARWCRAQRPLIARLDVVRTGLQRDVNRQQRYTENLGALDNRAQSVPARATEGEASGFLADAFDALAEDEAFDAAARAALAAALTARLPQLVGDKATDATRSAVLASYRVELRARLEAAEAAEAAASTVRGRTDLTDHWLRCHLADRPTVAHRLRAQARSWIATVALDAAPATAEVDAEHAPRRGSVYVTGVDARTRLSSHVQTTPRVAVSETLLKILPYFIGGFGSVLRDGAAPDADGAPDVADWVRELAPVVPTGVRMLDVGGISQGADVTMTICADRGTGDPACTSGHEDVAATLRFRPMTGCRIQLDGFTFLLNVGANLGPDAAFGPPSYAARGAPVGDRQLYVLDYHGTRRNRFTLSLLAGVRFGSRAIPDLLVLATGPAFIPKNAGGMRFQWDIRAGIRLARGVYLTAGIGLRRVATPRQESIGAMRVAAVGSPPSVQDTRENFAGVATIGIAVDLAALGGEAVEAVKAARDPGGT